MSQFADPAAPSGGMDLNNYTGALLLFQVLGFEPHVPTVHTRPGEQSPAVRATVSVLDGQHAGQVNEDTLIFPKMLQAQLKSRVGQLVLGRLGRGIAKPGQSAPWVLEPATDADKATADAFMRQQAAASVSSATPAQPPF